MRHTAAVSLSVDIPDEPDDRAVVLDRDANAWQRRGDVWVRVDGPVVLFGESAWREVWRHLVVDRQPLTRLITEAEEDAALDAAAGVTRADRGDLEHEVSPADPDDLRTPSIPDVITRRS